MDRRKAELKERKDAFMDNISEEHQSDPLLLDDFTDDALMDTESVSDGPVEQDMRVDGYPEPDTSSIYQSFRYENAFTYPDWLQQEDERQRPDRRPQIFRPVVAVDPYLRSAVEFVTVLKIQFSVESFIFRGEFIFFCL